MRTLLGPDEQIDEMIAKRRASGWDLYDYEIDGIYHMSPAPSIDHADVQLRVGAVMIGLSRIRDERFLLIDRSSVFGCAPSELVELFDLVATALHPSPCDEPPGSEFS